MHELDIISENLNELQQLARHAIIFLDDIPQKFRPDLQSFIVGETLSMQEGKIVIGNNLYRKWLQKVRKKGFDYEIDFKR